MTIARTVTRRLAERGAAAVVLGGSWARHDACRESDIDLWAFGLGSGTDVRWCSPFLVTVKRTTERAESGKLSTPPYVGGSVPGWRSALPLLDRHGIARRLKAKAARFRWSRVSEKCDRWVGDQMAGWAEEAVKLVRALATRNYATAAVQRNLLADQLGYVLAIHRRMFWDSENEFWEKIGRRVGGAWRKAHRNALGVSRLGIVQSCRGALKLYQLTAREVWPLLRPYQRSITFNACRVGGVPLSPSFRSS